MSPTDQARQIADRLVQEPFLVNLLPTLDNQVLVELFSAGADLPEGKTLQATASFVERLNVFGGKLDSVLAAGRSGPAAEAAELEVFLAETGLEQEADIKLFFYLFKDRDRDVATTVTMALPGETVQQMMKPVPFQLRPLLKPFQLLPKLGIEYASMSLIWNPYLKCWRNALTARLMEQPS